MMFGRRTWPGRLLIPAILEKELSPVVDTHSRPRRLGEGRSHSGRCEWIGGGTARSP